MWYACGGSSKPSIPKDSLSLAGQKQGYFLEKYNVDGKDIYVNLGIKDIPENLLAKE